jgi:hypothetical protein
MSKHNIIHTYITDNMCENSDNKNQSQTFCLTWDFTDDNLNTLRKLEHVYKSPRTGKETTYKVEYICFGIYTSPIPNVQAFIRFDNRITPATVSNLYRGSRVIKAIRVVNQNYNIENDTIEVYDRSNLKRNEIDKKMKPASAFTILYNDFTDENDELSKRLLHEYKGVEYDLTYICVCYEISESGVNQLYLYVESDTVIPINVVKQIYRGGQVQKATKDLTEFIITNKHTEYGETLERGKNNIEMREPKIFINREVNPELNENLVMLSSDQKYFEQSPIHKRRYKTIYRLNPKTDKRYIHMRYLLK